MWRTNSLEIALDRTKFVFVYELIILYTRNNLQLKQVRNLQVYL